VVITSAEVIAALAALPAGVPAHSPAGRTAVADLITNKPGGNPLTKVYMQTCTVAAGIPAAIPAAQFKQELLTAIREAGWPERFGIVEG